MCPVTVSQCFPIPSVETHTSSVFVKRICPERLSVTLNNPRNEKAFEALTKRTRKRLQKKFMVTEFACCPPPRQPCRVRLPSGLQSARVKWQRSHLNTGWAKTLISCERNVWLSSHVMQWCWWADKGLTNWSLPFLQHSRIWPETEQGRAGRHRLFVQRALRKSGGSWRIIVTSCLTPAARSDFGRDGGATSWPKTNYPMRNQNHYHSLALSQDLFPWELFTYRFPL